MKQFNFEESVKNFGTFQFEGKQIFAVEDAFADGTNENPIYKAHAIDKEENEYIIAWNQYATDAVNECFVDANGKVMGAWDDGSNACDWDKYTVKEL